MNVQFSEMYVPFSGIFENLTLYSRTLWSPLLETNSFSDPQIKKKSLSCYWCDLTFFGRLCSGVCYNINFWEIILRLPMSTELQAQIRHEMQIFVMKWEHKSH